MSLKIRLAKTRSSGNFFRIVVSEARSKRDGKTIDVLGFCNPKTDPPKLRIDEKKYQEWQARGAKPSEAVQKLRK
ncbi:MAG: 30S ribosomal protein S16 [Patescibacteria group bacterium]